MTTSPTSDLACFPESLRLLARRPWVALALGVLGAALGALPPALTIWARLPDQELARLALAFVALLPLEMYFIPRFQAEADARLGGDPAHPPEGWEKRFDERWPIAMGARFLLYGCAILATVILMPFLAVAAAAGFQAVLLIPTLLVSLAFGWAPLRVLLRGGAPLPAFRASLEMMKRAWRRVLAVLLGVGAGYILCLTLVALLVGDHATEPTPWEHLVRPGIWAGNFLATLANLWASTVLLVLFRRIEPTAGPADPANSNNSNIL
ncbi:MAG TPA: hypothetical protein VK188_13095 [Holophaga sp.]|nr:hypothetical protein [Holophaga sp.]